MLGKSDLLKLMGITDEQIKILRSPKGKKIRDKYRKLFPDLPRERKRRRKKSEEVCGEIAQMVPDEVVEDANGQIDTGDVDFLAHFVAEWVGYEMSDIEPPVGDMDSPFWVSG